VAPAGSVYQAGTLSGNPLAVTSGYTLLNELNTHPEIYQRLEEKSAYLAKGLKAVFDDGGIETVINRVGSMMGIYFTSHEVLNFQTASTTDIEFFNRYFHGMLKQGIYLAPSGYEALFVCDALSYEQLDQTINAAKKVLAGR